VSDTQPTASRIVRSRLPDVDIPDISLTDYVFRTAPDDAERVAIIDGVDGAVWTRGAVLDHARRLAGGLHGRGISTGNTVALMAGNGPHFAIAFHAVALTGAAVTPINPTYGADEIAHQLDDAGADLLIVSPRAAAAATVAANGRPVAVIGEASFDELFGEPLDQERLDFTQATVALPYSSGTTGLPKGVMLTHRNLVANLVQSGAVHDFRRDDVALVAIPMFHIYGLNGLMNACLAHGVPFVTLPRFELEAVLSLIQEHRITLFYGVPPVMLALARHPLVDDYDLSSLRRISCAAAPLGPELAKEVADRIGCPVSQAFGMTELSPMSHTTIMPDLKPGSSGVTVPNTESLIVDGADRPLGVDEVGQLLVRGPQVMAGYLNNPAATAETVDADGWLHTGDLARIDADGHLFIVGRVKELIKYNGFQVAPAELEALLLEHPDVADAAVIGVPDVHVGEIPTAFVVVRPGHRLTSQDVIDHVAAKVATYKRIRRVEFVDEIPKSAAGKILRRELHDAARHLAAGEPPI
jgi:acyl-CoA synthetase (AMP-forming)/AMP-acid ligase II